MDLVCASTKSLADTSNTNFLLDAVIFALIALSLHVHGVAYSQNKRRPIYDYAGRANCKAYVVAPQLLAFNNNIGATVQD
jgi:hypothetical protein